MTHYDVMVPIIVQSGKTVWCKVGVGWPSDGKKYAINVSLTTLPIGHSGPLELFLFEKTDQQGEPG